VSTILTNDEQVLPICYSLLYISSVLFMYVMFYHHGGHCRLLNIAMEANQDF